MSKLLKQPRDGGTEYVFWCPGCKCHHFYHVGCESGPNWQLDGDMDAPTFTPSLLVNAAEPRSGPRCHLYLTDGRLRYLSDCTHDLAGETVPLPDHTVRDTEDT